MKEKFDRNAPHKDIREIGSNNNSNKKHLEWILNMMIGRKESYIEECVKNGEKPRFVSFMESQDIDMNDDYNDLVIEFQEAIRCNNKMKVDFYGKKIIASLVNLGYSKEEILSKIKELIPTNKDLSVFYPIEDKNKIK